MGLFLLSAEDLEEEREDVYDIKVDAQSSKDIFLGTHGVPLVPHK